MATAAVAARRVRRVRTSMLEWGVVGQWARKVMEVGKVTVMMVRREDDDVSGELVISAGGQ